MADYTLDKATAAMRAFGHYRVTHCQQVAAEGPADGISGFLMMALGLRESGLQNINNPPQTDHGCFQISETGGWWDWLHSEPGCPVGAWRVQDGHTADEDGYCPRFTTAALKAIDILHLGQQFAQRHAYVDPVRFAVAAYNAGIRGAWEGYEAGDIDLKTTGGDYSAWVLRHRSILHKALARDLPDWVVST